MMAPGGLMGASYGPLAGLMGPYPAQGQQPVVTSPLEMALRHHISANAAQGRLNPSLLLALQGGLLGLPQNQSGLLAGASALPPPPAPDSRQIVRAAHRTHIGQSWAD